MTAIVTGSSIAVQASATAQQPQTQQPAAAQTDDGSDNPADDADQADAAVEAKPADSQSEKQQAENNPEEQASSDKQGGEPQSDKAAEPRQSDDARADDAKADKAKADDAKGDDTQADKAKADDNAPQPLPTYGYSDTPMIPGQPWRVHDILRPRPKVITPGQLSTYEQPGTAPSDAVVLFDGQNLDNWAHQGPDGPADLRVPQWKVQDGYMEIVPRSGSLRTIDSFGSCQLHIEWAAPEEVVGHSQGRGNSGVLLMGEYEVQVLDSHNNRTYADGQAGALYGQYPPMVNATRPPGQWQVYDIIFEAPRFDLDGKLVSPAYVTVMHNGVILHHRRQMLGPSSHKHVPQYDPQQPAAPLQLQDHGNPVRYRNIWIRPIDFQ